MTEHYELLYLVSMQYAGDELQKIMDEVTGMLKDNGATISINDILVKQKLAYPIKHVHQGTYVVVEFDMPKENVQKTETLLRLNNEVLRALIIKKKIKTAEEIEHEKKIQERLLKQKEDELAALDTDVKTVVSPAKEVHVQSEEVKVEAPAQEEIQAVDTTVIVAEEAPVAAPADFKDVEVKTKKAKSKVSLEDLDKKLDEILTDEII